KLKGVADKIFWVTGESSCGQKVEVYGPGGHRDVDPAILVATGKTTKNTDVYAGTPQIAS
ncbi:MAG: hypothetical protein K9G62_07305, partial [Alphaproteobacteria bacterium]|nr:hypothetical protein [Alphaproteobacteria bacterium]